MVTKSTCHCDMQHYSGNFTRSRRSFISSCYKWHHKKRPFCSWIVTGAQPNVHWCRQPLQSHCSVHASSSSTSTPSQSLGWRNITGFPWAPNLGSADRVLIFFAFRSAIAALMSSTCRKGSERVTINSSTSLEKSLRYYHPCVQKMCSWRRTFCTAHFLFGYYK